MCVHPDDIAATITVQHHRLDAIIEIVTVASSAAMASTNHLPIILDCDPGHDDAIAMVVAARHTNLLGITTVAGNAPLDSTTHNAIVVRDLLGIDVAVHAGAYRPLIAPPRHAGYVHGESGLDGADLPLPSGPPASRDAIGFIIDTVRNHDGVWLVPTGPMTNIALALRSAPDIAARIAGISFMGGGLFGNRTATAEFNIWADPEAAAIVLTYGGPLVMAGLDLTHQLQATPGRIDQIRAVPGRLTATLADLMQFFSAAYIGRHDNMRGAPVHDPCAVMALTHPQLFTRSFSHVAVEIFGEFTRGMTVIDQRTLIERPEPNCDRLTGVDADAAWAVVTEAIAHFSS
ncbi:MAG: nucleoside hydrolase [Actinomycetota bacterium]|nr:nucleoside hydrolase [Actinomycetota bacterium]